MTPDLFTDFSVHVAPTQAGGTEITIFGELDLATEARVGEALDTALGRSGPVVIDLRACPFVDSRGIRVLVRAALRLREEGRMLTLRGVQERVRHILDVAGLTESELLRVEPRPSAVPVRDKPPQD